MHFKFMMDILMLYGVQVIDETLRVVSFSLMVFREARKDVYVNGEFKHLLITMYITVHLINSVELNLMSVRLPDTQGLESSGMV